MARHYRDEEYEERKVAERRPRRPRRAEARGKNVKGTKKDKHGTPFLLKILSWLAIILLCFVAGYIGASYTMSFLDKKIFLKPDNRISNQEELKNLQEAERERARTTPSASGEVHQVSMNVYCVQNDTLAPIPQNFLARAQEDNIADALRSIFTLSGIPGAENIKILHVFRNTDTVFLDLSSSFVQAISSMGQQKGLLLLTGIVRTIQENFSPIVRVRFLIESKLPESGGPVDLSVTWQLPSRSA